MLKSIKPSQLAVVGYACRLPGAENADAFWSLLEEGRCSVTQVDPDRWSRERFGHPAAPGRSYTFAAGQLDDPWGFDAGFFGISPREAEQMDPQQRLMLEVAWEALEHSGLRAADLPRATTGVFVGASSSDYANRFYLDPAAIDAQFMTGNTLSLISNRISHALDLTGPSSTIDTACASGLYALHEAWMAMRAGLVDTAIVGGVNMLLSPFPFVGFSAATMLSKRGLCRAFDADGDGYVRSEGAVVFVLRALETAIAENDRILGVISGIGINSDGRTNGVSLPSYESQRALLEDVYQRLDLDPDRLAFVEAHGTGTRAGDPIETRALGEALGARRTEPLRIGSAKTNVGHLEAGSGLVGLLKAQMALERGVLPPSLHFETPNPDIRFDDWNLRVAAEAEPLPEQAAPLHAGVNNFGFGGANAHAVLRQPTMQERRPAPDRVEPAPLILSARSEESLHALASTWRDRLAEADADEAAALANAAAWRRDRHPHRLIATSDDPVRQVEALEAHLAGRDDPDLVRGRAAAREGRTAFVFSGNGAQHVGMGRAAYDSDPAFRAAFDSVSELFEELSGTSLVEAMRAWDLEARLPRTSLAQPLIFACQVATVRSLADKGLEPDAALGHSVGEVAAAWAAGAFDLADAVRLIHVRSRNQERIRDQGDMAAVLASAEAARAALAEGGFDRLEIAADNSPRAATIAGDAAQIAAFAKFAHDRRIAVKRLGLGYPFHSAAADALREGLLADLAWLRPRQTRRDFLSATFGRLADGEALGPQYWWTNIRRPVLFRQALEAALDLNCTQFLEIGPRPILASYVRDAAAARGVEAGVLPTLEEGVPADLRGAVARAAAQGARLNEARFFGPDARAEADLPRYAWRRQSYRIAPGPEALGLFDPTPPHPLLGAPVRSRARDWRSAVDPDRPAWLSDHEVEGGVVFPAAGYADMALAAGLQALGGDSPVELLDLDILRPLPLEPGAQRELRTTVSGDRLVADIESRPRLSDEDFALHARGRLRRAADPAPAPCPPPAAAGAGRMEAGVLYDLARRFGLDYGPAFRRALWVQPEGERRAFVALDPAHDGLEPDRHALHPALLDAAFHAVFALLGERRAEPGRSYLPVRLAALVLRAPGAAPAGAWVEITRAGERSVEAALTLVDPAGEVIAQLSGLRFKAAPRARPAAPAELAYRNALVRLAPPEGARSDLAAALTGPLAELTAETPPEPSAGALLIDTAARRICWDAAEALARPDRTLDPDALLAEGRLDDSARPLLARLLAALEEDSAVERTEAGRARLAAAAPYPPLSRLAEALFAEAPERIGEVMRLMALPDALPRLLAEGLQQTGEAAPAQPRREAADPAGEARWTALRRLLDAALARRPAGARLSLLILGAPPASLVARAAEAGLDRCVISDPDPRRARALQLGEPARPGVACAMPEELDDPAGFDLILAGDALHRMPAGDLGALRAHLAPGGALAAAEALPSVATDLTQGGDAAWWAASLDPDFPLGRLREGAEWTETLAEAGFAGVRARPLPDPASQAVLVLAGAPDAAPTAPAPSDGPALLILHGPAEAGTAEALAARVGEAGREARALTEPDLPAALHEGPGAELVLLSGLAAGGPALEAAQARLLAARAGLAAPERLARLWIVARGAVAAGPLRPLDPAEAACWGLARTLANEHPELDIRLADFSPEIPAADLPARLTAEILSPAGDQETVHDAAGRAGVRVQRAPEAPARARAAALPDAGARRLALAQPGAIDSLEWRDAPRGAPAEGEIEIEVAAAGLNFRDIMWAQGLLPEEALEDGFAGPTLGMECSGVVSRAGPGCARFREGDRVIAFAPACFASHVRVSEAAAAPAPEGLDLTAAATIPTAFLTAWYGLAELAGLAEGETVLIHGGAGGVGLAALQVAAARGARVFATAGTPAKRELLRRLGATDVFDSRSLDFAAGVLAATGGEGVDVMLNSLSGEAMERSLECLRPFGRFVELGKRDFYAGSQLGLRPFRRNLAYFGVDADQLLVHRPDIARKVFERLGEGFARGDFAPLPHTVFDAEEVVDAFRLMQKSGHVGKILVRAPRPPEPPAARPPRIRPDGACLVVGGLGGFGAETAAWLVARGAREIWLTSRSGRITDPARAAIQRMEAKGARVHIRACDAADETAMAALIDEIEAGPAPLRGVLHTAMALDDALFSGLDAERIRAVLAPKIAGAEVLDRLTRGRDLDFFIAYSSATTL
ncbi:MAG: SDR family NAD(P)-dependent oxidoreductase, partial [Pseudomonadota bacterium]